MTELKRIAVFCGSNAGINEVYSRQALLLGKTLAQQQIGIVYGGARVGLMKCVADGAIDAGGEVIGVLPRFFDEKELAHEKLSRIIFVDTMHERKLRMSELCDGVIALPGSYGTMDEFFEMLTWGQLGLHQKPVAILNIIGYYDPLIALTQNMTREGFLKEAHRNSMLISNTIPDLLTQMKTFQPPTIPKWI
jgi:uncharacterized protein (TIGR00730 family)